LFNFSHLAHQTYLTQPNLIQSLKELNFECSRLGDVQEDLKEIEPILRNTDMLSFDLSAIRMSDSPAHADGSPHGLYGEQACAIARYAGISNTLSSFGLYELNPLLDPTKQSTKLAAHLVWHFLQGFANRKAEHPLQHPKNFIRYMVSLQANDYEIVFWKSKTNDRWWMELPTFNNRTLLEKRFIPCSHKDYITASQDEIPLRWLNALHRMH
jgi:formiminoglutamase